MARRQINSEELETLFMRIGEGVWHLQNVEDALNNYIALKLDVKEPGLFTQAEVEQFLTKHRGNTLGKSLKNSKEAGVLSEGLQHRLEEFKEERNWLVHRSVYLHREDLYIDEKRDNLMRRIQAFSTEAKILQKEIDRELSDFAVSKGVNQKWIDQESEKTIRRLRGELV